MSKTIGKYEVIKALGEGGCSKVKLVRDPSTGNYYAAKIFKESVYQKDGGEDIESIKAEADVMKKIDHKNLVKMIDFQLGGEYSKKSGKSKTKTFMLLELAQGGELFDYIAQQGKFDEPTCRYFFKQILDGMLHIHQAGFCHRDLKCENIMMDKEFNIKIADFGFAAPADGKSQTGFLRTYLGSYEYMAPELHQKKEYSGTSVDVFNLAIILFMMATQTNSFNCAMPNDPFYKCIAANRADLFWAQHSKINGVSPNSFLSPELRKLLQAMFQLDPVHRPSLNEMYNHPWMQGPHATKQQVINEFQRRKNAIDEAKDLEQQQKGNQSHGGAGGQKRSQYRAGNFKHGDYSKALDDYDAEFNQNKATIFTDHHPDGAQLLLMNVISRNQVQVEVNQQKYKFGCVMNGQNTDRDGNDQVISTKEWTQKFTILISKVHEQKYCIEFQRKGGNQMQFFKIFEKLKQQILDEVEKEEAKEENE